MTFERFLLLAGAFLASTITAQAETPAVPKTEPTAPKAESTASPAKFEVEKKRNIAYREDKEADPEKHKLDLYLPKNHKNFPMLMFVHGGSWRSGNKDLYAMMGEVFAQQGVGTAVINYRLSDGKYQAKHPDHIQDVASAFAWLHNNAEKYGGRKDQIFVSGHSAGGHLVSLLATDDNYLKVQKLNCSAIKGVIALSGVYTIFPRLPVFQVPFGGDPDVCKAASPITHVKGNHPPFLVAYGDRDFPTLDKMAEDFGAKLKECKCDVLIQKQIKRDHFTIITNLMLGTKDPLAAAMFDFINKYTAAK